jgi:hypothetical protein
MSLLKTWNTNYYWCEQTLINSGKKSTNVKWQTTSNINKFDWTVDRKQNIVIHTLIVNMLSVLLPVVFMKWYCRYLKDWGEPSFCSLSVLYHWSI